MKIKNEVETPEMFKNGQSISEAEILANKKREDVIEVIHPSNTSSPHLF